MAKRPTQSRVRSANKLRAKDKINTAQAQSNTETTITPQIVAEVRDLQGAIDKYNTQDIFKIDPLFNEMMLNEDALIIRAFKEDYLKYIDESDPENIIIDAYFRQIDARRKSTEQPNWVATPFRYIEQGVICAIDPNLQLRYIKLKKELVNEGRQDLADKVVVPKVGDIVSIKANTSQWYKEARFYLNKQDKCKDFVRDQVNLRLNNFEHYFYLKDFDVESYSPTK